MIPPTAALLAQLALLWIPPAFGAGPVTQCKPCGQTPLEASLEQAELVVLAQPLGAIEPAPAKGVPGAGILRVQVVQTLYRSPEAPPFPRSKGLPRLQARFYWDGCRTAPAPFHKGERLVLFLVRGESFTAESPAWEAIPGHCALAALRPGEAGYDLPALRRRLRDTKQSRR